MRHGAEFACVGHSGKTVNYYTKTRDEYAAFGFPGAAEMANMWEYYAQFPYFADSRPLDKAVVKGQSFKEWVTDHKEEFIAKLQ